MEMLGVNRKHLKTVTMTMEAGEEKTIVLNGNFVKYETGNGSVLFRTNEGADFKRSVGGSAKFSEFNKINVTNLHTDVDQKTFTVGYGEVKDNAVSGTVDIDSISNPVEVFTPTVGSVKDKTLYGYGAYIGNVAAKYSALTLFNPVGSAKQLGVIKCHCSCPGNGGIQYGISPIDQVGTVGNALKLNSDNPVNVGKVGYNNLVVKAGDLQVGNSAVAGQVYDLIPINTPFIINPGESFIVHTFDANYLLHGYLVWEEITI